MNRFNKYLNSPTQCPLLVTKEDPHRNRVVQIRMIPGERNLVLMFDGTDSWLAPTSTGFLEDVRRMLEQIDRTRVLPTPEDHTTTAKTPPARRSTKAVPANPPSVPRHRAYAAA